MLQTKNARLRPICVVDELCGPRTRPPECLNVSRLIGGLKPGLDSLDGGRLMSWLRCVWFSALLLAAGCSESEGLRDAQVSGDGGFSADGGPSRDASTSDAAGVPDGGTAQDGGPSGMVTVVVEARSGAGMSDVDVVFHSADGDVLAHVKTDAQGRAMSTVPFGAMVTVVRAEGLGLETRGGIVPPETIYFRRFDPAPQDTLRTQVTVSLPGTFSGASVYYASSGDLPEFSERGEPITLYVYDRLVSANDTFAVVAEADQDDPVTFVTTPIAHSIAPMNRVTGSTQTVSMPPWSTAFFDTEVTIANLSPGGAVMRSAAFTVSGQQFSLTGNEGFDPIDAQMPLTFSVRNPDAPAVSAYSISYAVSDANLEGFSFRYDFFVTPPPSWMIDARTDFLGSVSRAAVNAVDAARPSATWTPSAGLGAASDLVELDLLWLDTSSQGHGWNVKLPADVTSFRVPALPAALMSLQPEPGATFDSTAVVYGDSSVHSWDDLRRGADIREVPGAGYFRQSVAF
jgi:hypothetical protein